MGNAECVPRSDSSLVMSRDIFTVWERKHSQRCYEYACPDEQPQMAPTQCKVTCIYRSKSHRFSLKIKEMNKMSFLLSWHCTEGL